MRAFSEGSGHTQKESRIRNTPEQRAVAYGHAHFHLALAQHEDAIRLISAAEQSLLSFEPANLSRCKPVQQGGDTFFPRVVGLRASRLHVMTMLRCLRLAGL